MQSYNTPKTNWASTDGVTTTDLARIEGNEVYLHDSGILQLSTGTNGTSITLSLPSLQNLYSVTFIATASNGGSATTINGLPLYKAGSTTAPTLVAQHAYTVWYNLTNNCFYLKTSASGTANNAQVLTGTTFTNDTDSEISGTMPNNGAVIYTPGRAVQNIIDGYHHGSTVAAVPVIPQDPYEIWSTAGVYIWSPPPAVHKILIMIAGCGGAGGAGYSYATGPNGTNLPAGSHGGGGGGGGLVWVGWIELVDNDDISVQIGDGSSLANSETPTLGPGTSFGGYITIAGGYCGTYTAAGYAITANTTGAVVGNNIYKLGSYNGGAGGYTASFFSGSGGGGSAGGYITSYTSANTAGTGAAATATSTPGTGGSKGTAGTNTALPSYDYTGSTGGLGGMYCTEAQWQAGTYNPFGSWPNAATDRCCGAGAGGSARQNSTTSTPMDGQQGQAGCIIIWY
jgi:hypothetical protein